MIGKKKKGCTFTTYEQRKGLSIILYPYFVLFLQNVLPRNFATMYLSTVYKEAKLRVC